MPFTRTEISRTSRAMQGFAMHGRGARQPMLRAPSGAVRAWT
ncbi:hypothetical protein P368_07335 [Comamonas thiooxydans]|nr:hypothetical protein P369_08240 [Comamonas thiooxydans]KGH00571.1 hypothetical protein P367_05950 [Comamonas thiooxydans]KGH05115.1 hypothetical protein P365_11305 [Comamonas thiooxydans]KGH14000.1 hypothetical protein P368_07335 [Comamonas thiooxydans]